MGEGRTNGDCRVELEGWSRIPIPLVGYGRASRGPKDPRSLLPSLFPLTCINEPWHKVRGTKRNSRKRRKSILWETETTTN